MKHWFSFTVLLFIMTVLAACGQGNTSQTDNQVSEDNSSVNEVSLLTEIKESGELVIGTEGTYPPYTFHNDEDKLTGFDVEIAREVAKRFDMVANQVDITPERQDEYSVSNPYIQSSAVIVTHEDNSSITEFSDLEGVKTAQSLTSNYADIARENGAEITSVEGFDEKRFSSVQKTNRNGFSKS